VFLALAHAAQVLRQRRRELAFPLADGLVDEHETTDEEHLGQIAQAEPVAQSPEHHEGDDVARILRPVQEPGAALVALLAAGPAAKPAIACAVRSRCSLTLVAWQAGHSIAQPPKRETYRTRNSTDGQLRPARSLTEPRLRQSGPRH
jgi:hypothetical protein